MERRAGMIVFLASAWPSATCGGSSRRTSRSRTRTHAGLNTPPTDGARSSSVSELIRRQGLIAPGGLSRYAPDRATPPVEPRRLSSHAACRPTPPAEPRARPRHSGASNASAHRAELCRARGPGTDKGPAQYAVGPPILLLLCEHVKPGLRDSPPVRQPRLPPPAYINIANIATLSSRKNARTARTPKMECRGRQAPRRPPG